MPQDTRSQSLTPKAADQVDSETRAFEAGPASGDLFELENELLAERPRKGPEDRGHGPKTRGRNKQIVSGRPYG
ncbi:hypothetical protein [Phenylobacterium sp.]|uniref:hypothetical protein n=1 Tax=Phenylobacterium sp. TaxID=1871053 RepID=UPI0027360428|nr:hypothetical protein [Phenylobacterium sp.]MDP3852713.1 hypothetical protein [Phenylobacterium sp.]